MVTEYGIKFTKVCENLLRRGPLTLQLIVRYTELTPQQVKNSLLILIQHNCVQAFSYEQDGGLEDGPKSNTQYMALFNNILHRMRFSKFLEIMSREFDDKCKELLEGLLQHGRLTLKQMVERAKDLAERAKSRKKEGICENLVQESLVKLFTARYVERCPASEPVLAARNKEDTPAKKRGPKSARTAEESQTLEQRVLAAAAPMEAQRFSAITNNESAVGRETSMDDSPGMRVGAKRKYDASELHIEPAAEEEVILWRANFEEFIRCLRHKACIENVRERLDDGAATVLRAMLEATRSLENKVKTEKSVPLSLNNIFEEVMKSEEGRGMTLDLVRASLVQLGCSPSARGTDESYKIDLKKIIELAQNDEVESIVLKRYGRDAYRMFRLLSKNGRLVETDKIANTTFVEKKDAPKILYKLWKDEYLHMEKLVVAGARQSQFLLWKVNKPCLWKHVLDEMFHAALNLSQRVAYEREKEKEFLNLPVDKQVMSQEERLNRLKSVRIVLESSLLKLDDALMLFHDFEESSLLKLDDAIMLSHDL
ncbi:DNA-directed RNA polymerase III subunit rpc-3 isoform X2 [Carya illinoinensis]|uniref:DNA-directed RNA polymerase III subunit RPC3 n=1 Tax=Carya illinoinensis TaxID=32201 RepID=A0A8T1R2Y1_CARIL|nr:DNA-directed RNA polymerase III subunit rpc-3 isoform X2 [Carya illinoinensis]KAG6660451.1 hypothetical protein CIPAW_03G107600 [Carya illinoinensis]KAG6721236.1 hypothetical protein I3842_03G102700 [Carya illinoinensis]